MKWTELTRGRNGAINCITISAGTARQRSFLRAVVQDPESLEVLRLGVRGTLMMKVGDFRMSTFPDVDATLDEIIAFFQQSHSVEVVEEDDRRGVTALLFVVGAIILNSLRASSA